MNLPHPAFKMGDLARHRITGQIVLVLRPTLIFPVGGYIVRDKFWGRHRVRHFELEPVQPHELPKHDNLAGFGG